MNLQELAARLDRVRFNGDSFMARCPAHPDNTPSLGATIGDNGGIILTCYSGCDTESILHALNITWTDLFSEETRHTNGNGNRSGKWNIARTYPYTDETGKVLFEVVRLEPKGFRQRQPDGKGGWITNLQGIKSKPLYRLPKVKSTVEAGGTVWLCEGEKDAERLQTVLPDNDTATTIPGGAGKWRPEHTDTLTGANVTIIADRDTPGRKHARDVYASLENATRSVKIVEPATGKDAADHLAAGYGLGDFVDADQPATHDSDDAPAHGDGDYQPQWDDEWQAPPLPPPDKPIVPADTTDEEEHTSWWPVDLAELFDGTAHIPTPTLFTRDDNQPILYAGKAHAFNGESESGKSWAALLACVQTITTGSNVIYIDFEDTAPTVVHRLRLLGAEPQLIVDRLSYIAPHDPLWIRDKITRGGLDLASLLEDRHYTLAIIDGVTEAMTMHGLDINSNNDVATFYRILPRRLKQEGTATVQIDHIPKNRENRGRGGIGGQHKLAGIDVSFVFEVTAPFGIGRHGIAKMSVEKDRPGQLRQHASGRRIAELHLNSDKETHELAASLKAPEGSPQQPDQWEPTHLMQAISSYVEECNTNGHHPSQNDIEAGVNGKGEWIRRAVANLVREGYVGRGIDGRKKYQHTSITPYTEDDPT